MIIPLAKFFDEKCTFEIIEAQNNRSKTKTHILIPRLVLYSSNVEQLDPIVKQFGGKYAKYGSSYRLTYSGAKVCKVILEEILPYLEKKSNMAITMLDFLDFSEKYTSRNLRTFLAKKDFKLRLDSLNGEFKSLVRSEDKPESDSHQQYQPNALVQPHPSK